MSESVYLTTAEVAALFRTSPETVRYWRHIGRGPKSFKVGRLVLYAKDDLSRFIAEARGNTDPPPRVAPAAKTRTPAPPAANPCNRCHGSGLEPWPVETGEADFDARLVEGGLDFEWVTMGGQTETWDWIKESRVQLVDGSWQVETYKPSGAISSGRCDS